jgi:PAS domain S-box-containing protein
MVTAIDITERKKAEAALRESEARFRSVLDNSNDCIYRLNVQTGRYEYISPSCENIVGYTSRELMALDLEASLAMIYPADLPALQAAEARCVESGKARVEYRQRTKGGELRWISNSMSLARDQNGRPLYRDGSLRDITERKRAEEELLAAKQQAELYLDLMGHDINNLNQVALGYLEMAHDMHPDLGNKELLEKPIEVLQRSARLIKNVQKLQKLRHGIFRTEKMDLPAILLNVQQEFGGIPGKTITVNLNGYEPGFVRANELLHDVFANLASNAVRHTGDKAEIIIDLDRVNDDGPYYRVVVEDDGPGIPDDSKEKVFNRMYKGTRRGMGLGLYLVKTLVESYGGRVWVEDRIMGDYTKGARFVVMLPAMEA